MDDDKLKEEFGKPPSLPYYNQQIVYPMLFWAALILLGLALT